MTASTTPRACATPSARMPSTPHSIPRSRIKFADEFEAADPDVFAAMLRFLTARGFALDEGRTRLAVSLPTLDKLAWRPDVRQLACNMDGGRRIGALSVVHHAMHGLVAFRYGSRLAQRPWISLLSESLASCLQLYFSLGMFRSLPPERHRHASAIEQYRRVGEWLGVEAGTLIERAARAPFDTFRRAVRSMMTVYEEIIAFDRRVASAAGRTNEPLPAAAELDEKLRALPEFLFVRTFDYGNNVLYTKVFCTLESCASDAHAVEDCLGLLDRSSSMVELVEALGAPERAQCRVED